MIVQRKKNTNTKFILINTTQTVPATTTAVAIMGNLVTNAGRCIITKNGGFIIKKSGVYTIKCDITFTATAAGTISHVCATALKHDPS